jgi:hypothetical protein
MWIEYYSGGQVVQAWPLNFSFIETNSGVQWIILQNYFWEA